MSWDDEIDLLFENLNTAILLFDSDKHLQVMNPAGESLLSSSKRATYGLHIDELFHDFPLTQAFDQALQTAQPFTQGDVLLNINHNLHIFVDCAITPLLETHHAPAILLECFNVDRQHRISREEDILARHHATSELIRGMAHEIKNPLGGLRGAAQLLQKELQNGDLKEYTRIIINEADRLRKLVDRILGPSDVPEVRQTNIHETLEHVYTLISAEIPAGITLLRDYDPSLPDVMADPDQLIQAQLNLLRNAVQALARIDNKGIITLKTRVERQITIGQKTHKLAARIDIIDNGPGIPEALHETIFYPMVTGYAEGTGLGLSIAQTLINKHFGYIDFTSQPGETVFTIWLPIGLSPDKTLTKPIEGLHL